MINEGRSFVLGLVAGAVTGVWAASAGVASGVPRERTFVASCDGSGQKYVEIVPPDFRPEAGALIALHGHGECKEAREAAAKRGLLYVSPHCRAKTSWMGPKAEADVLDLLAALRREYGVTAFYFCGGSVGGTAALTFAARHPDLVSGVVALNPLADHLSYDRFQDALAYPERFTMPVSITVGGADTSVSPESARELAKKISFCRPDLIYFDEVKERKHETDYAASAKAFDEIWEATLER